MPLTHSPDPVHLGTGAGTAAAQADVPQWVADDDGTGWVDSGGSAPVEHPHFFGYAVVGSAWEFWGDAGGMITFGEGSPPQVITNPQDFSYPADGPYTVNFTATGVDVDLPIVVDTSATRPHLTSITPSSVSRTGGPVQLTLVAENIDAGAVAMVAGMPQATTQVDPTTFTFMYDPVALDQPLDIIIYIRNPDLSTTMSKTVTLTT